MSAYTWEPGMVVFHVMDGKPWSSGRVAKVYKNGNCILEGDESRQQYRQNGVAAGDQSPWRRARIQPWSERLETEFRVGIKRDKVRSLLADVADMNEATLDTILASQEPAQ